MSRNPWEQLILLFAAYDRERASKCLLLTPDNLHKMLEPAEEALRQVGKVLPTSGLLLLRHWRERGSALLLDEIPRLLNPQASESAIDPTGRSFNIQFPAFSSLLDHTTQVAILIDPTQSGELVFAGLTLDGTHAISAPDFAADTLVWSWYPPKTLDQLIESEIACDVKLSPQMRQMYLRMGGCFSEWSFPYWCGPDNFDPGWLYDETYQTLVENLHLNDQLIARLRSFVVLSQDGTGDACGFFRNDQQGNNEYTFYQWEHETLDFSVWATDFADATQRLLRWRL